MKNISIACTVLLLSGCAVRVFTVPLDSPSFNSKAQYVTVKDERPDPQIYYNTISASSQPQVFLIQTSPSLDNVLSNYLSQQSPEKFERITPQKIIVNISNLDLKDRVGFLKNDEISCLIESDVAVTLQDNSKLPGIRVKTFAKNVDQSPILASSGAKIILDQCLRQHSEDILKKITNAN